MIMSGNPEMPGQSQKAGRTVGTTAGFFLRSAGPGPMPWASLPSLSLRSRLPPAGVTSWLAGKQGDERLRVGASPAGDRVPAGPGLVGGDGLARNIAVLVPAVTSWNAWWPEALRPIWGLG